MLKCTQTHKVDAQKINWLSFSAFSRCDSYFKRELRRNKVKPEHFVGAYTKFLVLNVDFNSPSIEPLFEASCAREHQRRVPPKKSLFYRCWLV